jgi:hypothetical protein
LWIARENRISPRYPLSVFLRTLAGLYAEILTHLAGDELKTRQGIRSTPKLKERSR